jgi:hypothetical protein
MSLNTIIISRGPKGEDGGAGGGDLSQTDIDSLEKLNGIVADATLIDTGDSRLSDARTPTAHTHTLSQITDAGTAAGSATGDFATAAQGTTADSALQPGGPLGTPSSGTLTNCTFPTLNQSTTGNAATATALETGRTINGVVFDGSQSITVGCLAVDVTGTLSLSQGGTSADTASGARTNLGLGAADDVTHASITTTGTVNTSSIATAAGSINLNPANGEVGIGPFGDGFALNAAGDLRVSMAGIKRWQFNGVNFRTTSVGAGLTVYPSFTAPSIMPNWVDNNTGLGWTSADILHLITGGVAGLTVNASQNVGIGTTTPAEKLEVVGNITASGTVSTGSYTVSTLPAVGTGQLIFVTNEVGGAIHCFSDGTNWRRLSDRAIVS